jgi:DNA polymerase-3 subunit beta
MEVKLSRDDLARALILAQGVISKKTTMPVLVNVLLTAAPDVLRVSATDLEVSAISSAPANTISSGGIAVSAKVFSEIVRELPNTEVTLKVSDRQRLEISCGNLRMRIPGVSPEEYPELPGVNSEVRGKLSAKCLHEMIQKTIYAVLADETRFHLNGVCFEIEGGTKRGKQSLRMVATDGHRLALISRPVDSLNFEGMPIVPRRGLLEIKKLLEQDIEGSIGLDFQQGFFLIENGRSKLAIRLVDGEFPDYHAVLPKGKSQQIVVDSSAFAQALRRVSLLVTDRSKCVELEIANDILKIVSSSPELGDASEEVSIQYAGEPLRMGFNAIYLLDVAQSLGESAALSIQISDGQTAARLGAQGDDSYIAVVMPMRLEEQVEAAADITDSTTAEQTFEQELSASNE